MKLSALPLTTLKEVPAEAEVISHQLMLRAALVRRLASGLYSWMPMGLRVARKVERIVREEMDKAGALELLMPAVQPAELWQQSGRWEKYGPELLRFHDRHEREFCFGPTHEEVITDIARRELRSYKQLPVNYYQIQTKFRDEIRPRFGVIRAREFVMKDAYSFHIDQASLQQGYEVMRDAYTRIFNRLGLGFRVVAADSGQIGGSRSEEFHVLADSGEDAIAYSDVDGFASNVELAEACPPVEPRAGAGDPVEAVSTPGVRTIQQLAEFLEIEAAGCVKTLLVEAEDGGLIGLVVRGDHELNALKAARLDGVATPLKMASADRVQTVTGCAPGFIGPVDLNVPLYVDHSAAASADFVCGANRADEHLRHVNWERDVPLPTSADIRNVVSGDPSPVEGAPLKIARGIEVGHVFQLGTQYSETMQATVVDDQGHERNLHMGCYGIGITRIVAAAIEQNHDERGIIWPEAMAPFQLSLIPINLHKSARVRQEADALYEQLCEAGLAVLYDDRDARPGVKFADTELLGIPRRIVIGERGLDAGHYEYQSRRSADSVTVPRTEIGAFLERSIARLS